MSHCLSRYKYTYIMLGEFVLSQNVKCNIQNIEISGHFHQYSSFYTKMNVSISRTAKLANGLALDLVQWLV